MGKVLVAGASGVVGSEVVRLLRDRGDDVRIVVRRAAAAQRLGVTDVHVADALVPGSLEGACKGVRAVVSCLGASVSMSLRDRRGFSSVDPAANGALLEEAQRHGVEAFVYVSVHVEAGYAMTRYVRAHEAFVEKLAEAKLRSVVVRPTGVFSAMGEFLDLAHKGIVPLIGSGEARTNPIHQTDVARAVVAAVDEGSGDRSVGGPDVMTRREIAELAFASLGKRPRLLRVPGWFMRGYGAMLRPLHPRMGELIEFAARVSETTAIAPSAGEQRLADFYAERARALVRA